MSKYFKSIVKSLATQAGIEVVRGYVIQRMRKVTAKDLYKAISENIHTMGVTEGKDRAFGKKWSKVIERYSVGGKRIRKEMLTPENVLEWLQQDRPDLASLIMNSGPKGMAWLEEDVKQIFSFLFVDQTKAPAQFVLKKTVSTPETDTTSPNAPDIDSEPEAETEKVESKVRQVTQTIVTFPDEPTETT